MAKKQVVFCTNSSLCSSIILEQLLAADSIEITGIYLSQRIRTKSGSFPGDIFRIIRTSGVYYACYLALATLVFDLFRFGNVRPTVKGIAKSHNIDVFANKDINSAESLEWLQSLAPDILFSGFFNQKLDSKVLSIPSLACVNLHPALLPKYKGVDPVFYYFLNKEKVLGTTLHRMDETYDTGELLNSLELARCENRSVFWHNVELFKLGTELFTKWVAQPVELLNPTEQVNPAELSKNDCTNSTESEFYDSWPTSEQIQQLKEPLFSWKDFRNQAKKHF